MVGVEVGGCGAPCRRCTQKEYSSQKDPKIILSHKPVGAAPLRAFGGYLRRYLKNGDYFA
jgi:hypothetical protein